MTANTSKGGFCTYSLSECHGLGICLTGQSTVETITYLGNDIVITHLSRS